MNKERTEIAFISRDVINLLAERECTVEEANEVLRITQNGIAASATVQRLEY